MASLFDVKSSRSTVNINGLELAVSGLSETQALLMAKRFPGIDEMKELDYHTLETRHIEAMAALAAGMLGHFGDQAAEAHVIANFSADQISQILEAGTALTSDGVEEGFGQRSASSAHKPSAAKGRARKAPRKG